MTAANTHTNGKKLTGTVVSPTADSTAVVAVYRYVRHPKYGKFMRKRKRYLVHDPSGYAQQEGGRVTIVERPRVSKRKAFEIVADQGTE